MSLLAKVVQQLKTQDQLAIEAASLNEAIEASVEVRGRNQLMLLTDDICPHCTEPMITKNGTNMPLQVCIKCRISLPGQTETSTASDNMKIADVVDGTDPEPDWVGEHKKQRKTKDDPKYVQQSMLDEHDEHIPTDAPDGFDAIEGE